MAIYLFDLHHGIGSLQNGNPRLQYTGINASKERHTGHVTYRAQLHNGKGKQLNRGSFPLPVMAAIHYDSLQKTTETANFTPELKDEVRRRKHDFHVLHRMVCN